MEGYTPPEISPEKINPPSQEAPYQPVASRAGEDAVVDIQNKEGAESMAAVRALIKRAYDRYERGETPSVEITITGKPQPVELVPETPRIVTLKDPHEKLMGWRMFGGFNDEMDKQQLRDFFDHLTKVSPGFLVATLDSGNLLSPKDIKNALQHPELFGEAEKLREELRAAGVLVGLNHSWNPLELFQGDTLAVLKDPIEFKAYIDLEKLFFQGQYDGFYSAEGGDRSLSLQEKFYELYPDAHSWAPSRKLDVLKNSYN